MPAHIRKSPVRFDTPEQEAFLNLWRTYDRLQAIEEAFFDRFGLTAQQYNAMRLLQAARPDLLPTLAVADRLVSRAPDITRLLDKLERRGLVFRERSPRDRRVVHLGITDAGIALLDEIAGPLRACHEKQLGHLSAADLKRLVTLLKAVRQPHEPEDSPWRTE